MMRGLIKHCPLASYVLWVLLLWGLRPAAAQTLSQTFQLAEGFYSRADYTRAAQAYSRVLFFDQEEEYGPRCFHKMADCQYNTGKYDEAALYYDRAYQTAATDSARVDILFRKASCYLLTHDYRYAQLELLNLPDILSKGQQARRDFYLGILHFSLEEYDESRGYFLRLAPDSAGRAQVEALFLKNNRISRLSPRKARRLSILLPGLGQFYAGDVKNGMNSLLLTSGLLYWGGRLLATGAGIDAVFTVLPWFQRYYSGGYNKAAVIVEERKLKRRNVIYNQLLDVINTE